MIFFKDHGTGAYKITKTYCPVSVSLYFFLPSCNPITHSRQWPYKDFHMEIQMNVNLRKDGKEERWDKSLHGERVKEKDLQEGKSGKGYRFIHYGKNVITQSPFSSKKSKTALYEKRVISSGSALVG